MADPLVDDLDPYSIIVSADPTTLDPSQFVAPVKITSQQAADSASEASEERLLMAISVAGIGIGIIVGWIGASRR